MADPNGEMEKILERLQSLELRLSKLESCQGISERESFYRSTEQDEGANGIIQEETLNDEEKGLSFSYPLKGFQSAKPEF